MEWEIRAQRFFIDGVFLLVELVAVVPPVPHHDLGVGVIGIGSLQLLQFRNFTVEFWLNACDQIVPVLAILTSVW